MAETLLNQIRSLVTVDVDSMDPAVAHRHTKDGKKFVDMTSNQAIVFGNASPEAIQHAVDYAKSKGDATPQRVLDVLTVQLAMAVLPYLTGNVHAQTTPRVGYSYEGTLTEARRIIATFEELGVPKSRVCIKIPVTAEGALACKTLQEEGIQTLGTCVFGLEQALAAGAAGCLYLAPYFNELQVHFVEGTWKAYEVGIKNQEHPMIDVVRSIVAAYKKLGIKTFVMPASIVTALEVSSLTALKVDHLTLSGGVLDELATLPPVALDRYADALERELTEDELKILKNDYLADGGKLLKEALISNAETARKLGYAIDKFAECEEKTIEQIKKFL
ncbi:aldolase [Cylindrobasidium torrendii FP15055 ss-10]|uniref:Aldolase n=1 Tax=Cylindrobasidium torrendii FP15055 ss-10 TaxID=1314674 RepID=A0A0D7BJB1_9AGAR|nr:aldolase [Cylindrobasidium torrendii FP15055 ss-10]